ncbi:MAG TPA: CoA-binding protein [Syntrophales bacterium]|nr:CoA-binding protein [Syntrophales bacterium]HOL59403.1 CoA-binding protein [Syntrophales bacterium]HPO35560.1 CoA-binding protein [Syntrophales bacterium]
MISQWEKSPLYRIAYPRSIAFFGASNNFNRMGSIMLSSLQSGGFEGPIYPVHPKEETVRGLRAYRSVQDLPEVPDLAIIVLPTEIVCDTLEECGKKGIKHAIVVSGGFREMGSEGLERQKRLVYVAKRYGMNILGPNCLGVANLHHKFNPTPIEAEGEAGFVGLASQSGSFITQMFNYLYLHGMGFSTAFSVGNEAVIDIVDCLEYLGACPHTKVITLYLEGISRGREFMKVAREIVPHKPIVALYVGGSETGKKAGLSHTGALSGPDDIYDAVFRQCGIIRARTLVELFDFALALGTLPAPQGNRVVIQTHSGGPGATAADACGRAGLRLPDLSPETVERLRSYLPHTASTSNPVDLTFSKNNQEHFSAIPDIILEDEEVDMLLIYFLSPVVFIRRFLREAGVPKEQMKLAEDAAVQELTKAILDLRRKHAKPIVGYTFRSLQEKMTWEVLKGGIPIYPDAERAARAMAALVRYHRIKSEFHSRHVE